MRARRSLPVIALVCGVHLAGIWVIFQLRPLPVHPDEFLPLFSRAYIQQPSSARSEVPADWAVSLLGFEFPRYCYPHIGPLKGLLWAVWPGGITVTSHRLGNLLLLWGLLLLLTSLAPPGGWARRVTVGLLLGDLSLLVLGITDEGPILLLLLGGAGVLLLLTPGRPLRRWEPPVLAVLVFLGTWDRLNFVWLLLAGLGAAGGAAILMRDRGELRALIGRSVGVLVGLIGATLWLPGSFAKLLRGAGKSHPLLALPGRWWDLTVLATPFGAFHRYVEVGTPPSPWLDSIYRWGLTVALLLVALSAGLRARRLLRDRSPESARGLYLLLIPLLLWLEIVKTRQTWSSHHMILLKPFLYLALATLVTPWAQFPTGRRRWAVALLVLVVTGSAWLGVVGYRDCLISQPLVSWNALETVRVAGRYPLSRIHVLDWGAYWPGVVLSRPEQRWERELRVRTMEELQGRSAHLGGGSFGAIFRAGGRGSWLLQEARREGSPVRDIRRFGGHPGPVWMLAVIAEESPGPDRNVQPWRKLDPGGTDGSQWVKGVRKAESTPWVPGS